MTTTASAPARTTSADRLVGAAAHLGVPIMGPFLPLVVGAVSEQPFRKEHARQALTFQLGFIVIWIVVCVLSILVRALPPSVMIVVLGVAFLAEVPQIARALTGRPPFQLARDSWHGGPYRLIDGTTA